MLAQTVVPPPAPPPAARAPPPPIPTARPARRRFRLVRAYGAALRIALSYLAFWAAAHLRGRAWADRARPALHRRNGRRLRRAILRLRGLFVKAGQLASALTTFLPDGFRAELEGLQDQVPAAPFEHVRARVRAELGAEPDALFATFDRAPVASASLAQVHRATLPDGRAVAVKVQHADIEGVAALDLRAIETILRVVGRLFGVRGLREQMRQIEAVIAEELDFEHEARNLAALAALFPGRPDVAFPEAVPERSSRRVLTTTWMDGTKSGDTVALDALGLDRTAVAERLLGAYAQMIFRDGLYHADPHPGNLLVRPRADDPGGTLVFLDFGAVARLTPDMRRGLAEMIAAVLARDPSRVTSALLTMGFEPTGDGRAAEAVAAFVEGVHARVLDGLNPLALRFDDLSLGFALSVQADAFGEMRAAGVSVRDLAGAYRVPKDWILMERTALLLLGLGAALAPGLNPLRVLAPYVEPLARAAAPDAFAAFGDRVLAGVQRVFALPETAVRVVERVDRGEVQVRVREVEARLGFEADRVVRAARGVVWAVFAVGSGGVGYAAHVHGDGGLAAALVGGAVLCAVAALRRR
ncbi:MAG TPA: AarF/ABC1/UbiB kinase family protein [Rubricoccaceae bacterium]